MVKKKVDFPERLTVTGQNGFKDLIRKAALASDMSMASWCRKTLIKAAWNKINEIERTR